MTEKYQKIISYSFDFLAALSVPMVVGTVILAFPIIFIVSTPEFLSRLSEGFYGSDIALQILIFAILAGRRAGLGLPSLGGGLFGALVGGAAGTNVVHEISGFRIETKIALVQSLIRQQLERQERK